MAISAAQKRAIEDIVNTLCTTTKGRRRICDMFMELPNREAWPEYYKVIPEPRCIDGIKADVDKGKYKDPLIVYDDLVLVFANALHYNESGSQISKDAATLKASLEETWKNTAGLPPPPPPSPPAIDSAQRPLAALAPATPRTSHSSLASTSRAIPPTVLLPTLAAVRSASTPVAQVPQPADEDGDMSPEPQEHESESHSWEFAARHEESAEIVRQLERGLPRWEGGDNRGWMEDDVTAKYTEILNLLQSYRNQVGQHPWQSLEEIPENAQVKDLSFSGPISYKMIETRVRTQHYATPTLFDQDMGRLFERARRWHTAGTEAYGLCILLQRLYHLLTSPPLPNIVPATTSNFSSIAAGPGVARPLHSQPSESLSSHAVTTFRIPTKDRVFTEELTHKGMSIRVGDWVHLMNPDEPARPIIAQVFKTWVPDGDGVRKTQQGLTACWYFRPEQTVHPAHRQFWEGEIFKTGHFADHVAEDIIEKIACQFTAKHVRGRPRPPYWYPGWPLYVCDSRYNDRERVFVKIKNWNSCIPEDYRKNDFMPIYPFERIIYPKRHPSPFLSGVTGPGGIGDSIERAEGEKIEGGGTGRKRARKNATGPTADNAGPRYGTLVGAPGVSTPSGRAGSAGAAQSMIQAQPAPNASQRRTEDRSIGTAAGGLANLQGNAIVDVLPAETVKHFDRDPETNQVLWFSGPPIDVARTPAPQHSLKYLHYLAKRKKEEKLDRRKQEEEEDIEVHEDADGDSSRYKKRRRTERQPRMTDTLAALWASVSKEEGFD
ncbi:hypothetical protein K439DRAFT_1384573 [Ramaria rubella]|nr:hypothetical protein K439DRAFT_1384573 [Ramaria rubella]